MGQDVRTHAPKQSQEKNSAYHHFICKFMFGKDNRRTLSRVLLLQISKYWIRSKHPSTQWPDTYYISGLARKGLCVVSFVPSTMSL